MSSMESDVDSGSSMSPQAINIMLIFALSGILVYSIFYMVDKEKTASKIKINRHYLLYNPVCKVGDTRNYPVRKFKDGVVRRMRND